ncbi:MAG: class I SAM-dependent methyltransferase [Aridibacter sp.]
MKEKYDRIGMNYNNTRKADSFIVERLLQHLKLQNTGKYLDIGCGTGNYTIALNQNGFDFIGVEPSTEMLEKAKAKNSKVEWKLGKSENIPLENETVDGILATLTIHHWKDFDKSFAELNRVLKPNGRLVIFTSTNEQMNGYWLNYYFPKMLKDSTDQMPKFEVIQKNLFNNGFEIIETEKYFVRANLEDLFLYSGKHNPKMYLNKQIRHGISSFSDLANMEEIEKGLRKLESDIETGKVQEIITNYENNNGDYLFLIAKKKGKGQLIHLPFSI